MEITRIKSGRRSKTCYKSAIFTELQQIKNYAKPVAIGQLSCWNSGFSSTELAGFRMVFGFTAPRHFVQLHAFSFTSPFLFVSSFTCFFHLRFGRRLPLFLCTSNYKAFFILSHFHHLSSKRDYTTAYYLL